ncbi:hypothetical protein PENSTE_c019G07935 [Penicillium steckii]|uniref:Trichothecene 3-O-acetyltransferase-like N-terminal domain-containing protein n=1 Tax=Penicillium steckii TaxID=303698 RepID=A0A1V6SW45_9EURO|nr:hypothetical protein PENSTE_c019G07935 [Penicillium steckii]
MDILPGTQDVFGQLPRMKGYTHLALYFPHSDDCVSRENTATALRTATSHITTALPWIGGTVVNTGMQNGSTGTFAIARCAATEDILKIQDRSDVCPSYEDIINVQGVGRQLDVSLLSEQTSLPDSYIDQPAPVITLTVSWIRSGLVLDCAAQHNILDMRGIDQFLRLLAISLQNQTLDGSQVIEVNLRDRMNLFPLLGVDEERCDHSELRVPSNPNSTQRPRLVEKSALQSSRDSEPAFHHFRIKSFNLDTLKSLAETPSIDDALSAFIWKSLSTVRRRHGQPPEAVTGFTRAIDCRRTLHVPTEYMGQMAVKTYSKSTLAENEQSSLTTIAALLRKDVQRIRDRHWLRSLATLTAEEPDKSTFNFGKEFDPETWINASSWAGVAAYKLHFGLLGKPALVRRPDAKPVQGILIFLPRFENGDMDVLLCLREFEIQGLRELDDWNRFAEYIG